MLLMKKTAHYRVCGFSKYRRHHQHVTISEARVSIKKLQQAVEEKDTRTRRAHERILEQQRLLQQENKALKTCQSRQRLWKSLEKVPVF